MEKLQLEKKPLIIAVSVLVFALVFAFSLGFILRGCEKIRLSTYTTDSFEYKSDISGVKDVLNTKDKEYLLLVNKENALAEDYEPANLVNVAPEDALYGSTTLWLEENTYIAAKALLAEMKAEGYDDIYITSGYRTYKRQATLFSGYIDTEMRKNPELTRAEAEKIVLTYSARPGTSEHQSGLCIDFFVAPGMTELVNYGSEAEKGGVGFAETKEFEWLRDNAHKFGFILRFPEGEEQREITGYDYESWHYRFVGVNAATNIYNNGLTLEEYLD